MDVWWVQIGNGRGEETKENARQMALAKENEWKGEELKQKKDKKSYKIREDQPE